MTSEEAEVFGRDLLLRFAFELEWHSNMPLLHPVFSKQGKSQEEELGTYAPERMKMNVAAGTRTEKVGKKLDRF